MGLTVYTNDTCLSCPCCTETVWWLHSRNKITETAFSCWASCDTWRYFLQSSPAKPFVTQRGFSNENKSTRYFSTKPSIWGSYFDLFLPFWKTACLFGAHRDFWGLVPLAYYLHEYYRLNGIKWSVKSSEPRMEGRGGEYRSAVGRSRERIRAL